MLFMTLMVPLILLVTFSGALVSSCYRAGDDGCCFICMNVKLKNVQLEEAQAELERLFGADGLAGQFTGQAIHEFQLGPLLGQVPLEKSTMQ